jgi:osmotically inducible protein OsmC
MRPSARAEPPKTSTTRIKEFIMDAIYTTEALSTGAGRDGHISALNGALELELRQPKEMGGSGDGVNPEALFASGYAACFHSALQLVARQQKVQLGDSSVGARVSIGDNGEGGFKLAVQLEVVIPELDHDQAQALADAAHQTCPYSNATRGNIDVTVTVSDD